MLSYAEARSRVLALAAPLEGIEIALSEAVGLVLAEPLAGDVDLPPFDRAGHDGYAVLALPTPGPGAGSAWWGRRGGAVGPPSRAGRHGGAGPACSTRPRRPRSSSNRARRPR